MPSEMRLRHEYFVKSVMWLILLLLLLGTSVSNQQEHDEEQPHRKSELTLHQQEQLPEYLDPHESQYQSRQHFELQKPQEQSRQHLDSQESQEQSRQPLEELPKKKLQQAESQSHNELQQPETRAAEKQQQQPKLQEGGGRELMTPLTSVSPVQRQEEEEQEDGEQRQQPSQQQDQQQQRQQQQGLHRQEEQLKEEELPPFQNMPHRHPVPHAPEKESAEPPQNVIEEVAEKKEEVEEEVPPLSPNLPSLRWGQTARLTKCCPAEEVLVRRRDGNEPACEPVSPDQRWRPLFLNGRSGRRTPPDARSTLVSGNISCPGEHFWLDSTAAGGRFELLTTGHLYLRRVDALLEPLSFCADRLLVYTDAKEEAPKTGRAARVCALSLQERRSLLNEQTLIPTCARRTCLRKCCPRGLKVRWGGQLCVPQTGPQPWLPEFQPTDGHDPPTDLVTVSGNPPCRAQDGSLGKVFALQPAYDDNERFFLREDGRLWVPYQNATIRLEDFCVDQVEYEHPQQPGVLVDYHAAIVCFGRTDAALRVSAAKHVFRALILVSALFLLATLVVYSAVPELRNLHGRCLMSHVAALLTAYSCNLAGQTPVVYSNMAACQTTGLVMYFSFLAACFWLNAMSFDIWLTFSRLRSASPNRSQTGRFVRYSVYCWCCPLVLTAVVLTMQLVPNSVAPPENFIRPRIGEMSCWFPGSLEMLAYFHAPILVLMSVNFIFFVLTAKNLLQTEKDTRLAGRQKKGTERFKIYVNLFIVMGITWIAEALSFHLGPKEIWLVTDVFNALQGFFIFLLFTLRHNTRSTIRKHFAASSLGRCCCKVTSMVPLLSSRAATGRTMVPGSSTSAASGPQNDPRLDVIRTGSNQTSDTPV